METSQVQLTPTVQTARRELKRALVSLYGDRLDGLYLYGSFARGTANEDSDIDVLLVLRDAVKPGAEISRVNPAVSEICLRHDLLISIYPVSTEWFQNHSSPFLQNVRREAVAV